MQPKLKDNDWIKLQVGLEPGASLEEKVEAKELLKRFGFEKKPPSIRKRGPKPKESTNQTEHEIAVRIEFLRLMLGDNAKNLTVVALLSSILGILKKYREKCESYIALNENERATIYLLDVDVQTVQTNLAEILRPEKSAQLCIARSVNVYIPNASEFVQWIQIFAEHVELPESFSWVDLLNTGIAEERSKNAEKELYSELNIQLGLKLPKVKETSEVPPDGGETRRTKSKGRKTRKSRDKETDDNKKAEDDENRLEMIQWQTELYGAPSRIETLRAIPARMFKMRDLVESCKFVKIDAMQYLVDFVRWISCSSPLSDIPEVIGQLDTLFLEAIKRQGISPFPELYLEELNPGPSLIPEDGQLNAKLTGERIDLKDVVHKIVKATGQDGILKKDIVKKLNERRECPVSTAYAAINRAIKSKLIISQNGGKYVWPDPESGPPEN